jgi:hypothetical protein
MNEQLQQALTAILNKTMQGVDAGVSFLKSELPDVLQQLLTFKLVYSVVEIAILSSLIFLFAWSVKAYHKTENTLFKEKMGGSYMPTFPTMMYFFIGTIACVIFMIAIFCDIEVAMKIWLAPKIYLIEYAAKLAK